MNQLDDRSRKKNPNPTPPKNLRHLTTPALQPCSQIWKFTGSEFKNFGTERSLKKWLRPPCNLPLISNPLSKVLLSPTLGLRRTEHTNKMIGWISTQNKAMEFQQKRKQKLVRRFPYAFASFEMLCFSEKLCSLVSSWKCFGTLVCKHKLLLFALRRKLMLNIVLLCRRQVTHCVVPDYLTASLSSRPPVKLILETCRTRTKLRK